MPENTIGLKEMDSTSMNSAIHLNSPDKQKQQQQQQQQQQDWIDSPTALEHSWPHPTTPFPMQRQRQRQRGFLTRIDKKIVWEYAVHWRWLWASIAFSLCMGAIMFHYRRELLQTLESLSKTVKGMGARYSYNHLGINRFHSISQEEVYAY
ncbi:hypothetical protein BDF14DRAFT_1212184 [Spinellus fusiger]|nr:hypothetical protein BDF14DRAFT_1212184 [Spinellus fusiger]